MLTTERSRAGKAYLGAQRSPRVIRILGATGTARQWAEDLGAVVTGLLLVAEVVALLWMVAGR